MSIVKIILLDFILFLINCYHSSFQSNAGALLTNLPKALLIAIAMALFTLVFGEIGWKNGALVLVR